MEINFGNDTTVEITSEDVTTRDQVMGRINTEERDAFCVGNLGDIIRKHKMWQQYFPNIEPFYAVKCNPFHPVIKLMVDMGLSFDCASKNEIQQVLELGVNPSRIIYANPCKQESFLRYAELNGVDLMTFDNEDELYKIQKISPNARLILRILPPGNFKVRIEVGNKFGCHPTQSYRLLQAAKRLGLTVVGVGFHVGSGCLEPKAFVSTIRLAREVFDMGKKAGFNMEILNIGGGFPGDEKSSVLLKEIAALVNESLDKYFHDVDVRIIAEPGRFYVCSAFTIATNIISRRIEDYDKNSGEQLEDGEKSVMYYINAGIYRGFLPVLFTPSCFTPKVLKDISMDTVYRSSIWGPTCDGNDCVLAECKLPELNMGDWIYFEDMGAYTFSLSMPFNGMPELKRHFICSKEKWEGVYPPRNTERD